MSDNAAILVDDIHFSYHGGQHVLKGLSCEIKHGEKVALIGPNGAGKSTFMSHLNGVSIATSGKVWIDGIEVCKDNLVEIRKRIGIVFQDPDDQLFCPTVFDDVAFGPLNLGLSRDAIHARVAEALDTVGLAGFEERSSFHLSFGERKRLALATVLSYQPDILVFDEPSTNMDPLNRRKLIEWLQNTDKTILLCTHDLDIALDVCDRCLMLADGTIVSDGPASEVLYDRKLLEDNNLELPLALMTHELLHDKLKAGKMDKEHRRIIEDFLHAHRHVHGPDDHEHVHLHAHDHDHGHMHDDGGDDHAHDEGEGHGHGHGDIGVPHSHDAPGHSHDGHSHDHDHDHGEKKN
ncbi:MAG: energy-coupling factor ABC transporter ATP-binding protein [Leptospirillia bacterium]